MGRPVPVRDQGEVRAPGTLASHYAPRARVVAVDDVDALARSHAPSSRPVQRVGVLARRCRQTICRARCCVLGAPRDVDEYADELYRWLRDADAANLDVRARGDARRRRGRCRGRRPVCVVPRARTNERR